MEIFNNITLSYSKENTNSSSIFKQYIVNMEVDGRKALINTLMFVLLEDDEEKYFTNYIRGLYPNSEIHIYEK